MIYKIAFIVMVMVLNACTVGPNYQAPTHKHVQGWTSAQGDIVSQESIAIKWWEGFDDAVLTRYIETAADHNKDVEIALANIVRARALKREKMGGLFPSFSTNAGVSRQKQSTNARAGQFNNTNNINTLYDAGFDASWELDIFGGRQRDIEASSARVGAANASYEEALLVTLSEVARLYYEIRGTQKRITVTQENVDLFQQTYQLIQKRLEVGEATQFDVTRAFGQYQATQALLPNLEAELSAAIFSLSVLLGQPPESLMQEMMVAGPSLPPAVIVPVGMRSDVIRRRPDIKIAERELAASNADIGVQVAELFPSFFLTGDIGSQARTFGSLFTAGAGVWSLGTALEWSVFEGGAIRARIDSKKAENKAALAAYEKAILEALADVETALTRYGREVETQQKLEATMKSRQDAAELVRRLLEAGEADYLAVLDAQRELATSKDNLVVSQTRLITKLIALYNALGGGWEAFI